MATPNNNNKKSKDKIEASSSSKPQIAPIKKDNPSKEYKKKGKK